VSSIPFKPTRLALSGRQHRVLFEHLFPGDGNEAVAFALGGRARRQDLELIVVREVITIPYSDCKARTPHRVTWPGTWLEQVLRKAASTGQAVVKIHSHPVGYPWFSQTDDIAEAEMFPSVFGWLDTDAPMASLIMMPDGKLIGRAVQEDGSAQPLDCIRVAGDDFHFWHSTAIQTRIPAYGHRVAQTFGDQTYQLLQQLRVGVVGCSGTGSIVIEQLARNCIGGLVLVDPDHVEDKNLNRIVNSTAADARNSTSKCEVLHRAIDAMGLGTEVMTYATDLMDKAVLLALSTCDVLFGCMDSVDGRHLLNKLASTYVIPLIDVGVRLDADGNGGIDSIWTAVHTVQPGGSSLLSRGVYDMKVLSAASLKRANPAEYESQVKAGYIKGGNVERPAVISVNMHAASLAVNELLARVHRFRIAPNAEFAIVRSCLTDPEASSYAPDGQSCSAMTHFVGSGDQIPFLGLLGLES